MELEIARLVVICIISMACLVFGILGIIIGLDYRDRYRHVLKANQSLLKENITLKAKLSCMDFYKNEEKENKKVGKK